ncbi:Hypothetical protein SMAX5B_019947 [Scophthalmus maximus]|uniref:Uncharacterized protein n=1 Tax=Scophthalmus maximus TaxID=52904 RepID=A0A2U9B4S3_SCOMX|nr:Hypothetical protein SMAX5B_019947 [Scophthalmus maximus]
MEQTSRLGRTSPAAGLRPLLLLLLTVCGLAREFNGFFLILPPPPLFGRCRKANGARALRTRLPAHEPRLLASPRRRPRRRLAFFGSFECNASFHC